ncbi:hypothetical protein C9J85_00855 [Haloferax sp. wsp5]|nr:hypothetical protein C9J85_00855 [Haloferax sp. wsp5]
MLERRRLAFSRFSASNKRVSAPAAAAPPAVTFVETPSIGATWSARSDVADEGVLRRHRQETASESASSGRTRTQHDRVLPKRRTANLVSGVGFGRPAVPVASACCSLSSLRRLLCDFLVVERLIVRVRRGQRYEPYFFEDERSPSNADSSFCCAAAPSRSRPSLVYISLSGYLRPHSGVATTDGRIIRSSAWPTLAIR